MLHFDRDGDEPPARTIENCGAHDLSLEAERLGHIDSPKLGDTQRMLIDRKLIVGKVEAQSIPFLASSLSVSHLCGTLSNEPAPSYKHDARPRKLSESRFLVLEWDLA